MKLKEAYEFFRYEIPIGCKNFIIFFKVIWNFRRFDYAFTLDILYKCIEEMSYHHEKHGMTCNEDRIPIIQAMNRVCILLKHVINDNYIELAKKELGNLSNISLNIFKNKNLDTRTEEEIKHDKTIFELARKIEEEEWDELFDILKGDSSIKGSNLKAWWD